MAGTKEPGDETDELQSSDRFIWDETSQLYFHASSGFYHEPNAGWYYSSRDGLYYKFENGNYVLLDSHRLNECDGSPCEGPAPDSCGQDEQHKLGCGDGKNFYSIQLGKSEAYQSIKSGQDESSQGQLEYTCNQTLANPPPPSAWLEETLIDLYLCGYNEAAHADNGATMSFEMDDEDKSKFSAAGKSNDLELEEGEWIPEDHDGFAHSSVSWDEENWRSQYGQVIQSEEEAALGFPVIELWDWSMVRGCRKQGKDKVARLVGHLVRRSAKLHPSIMPSSGGLFKTAPICEVRRDLVRVTTGQVYRLRTPSAKYLAALSCYDSSNPTKDWGFPEFYQPSKSIGKSESQPSGGVMKSKHTSTQPNPLSASGKPKNCGYRDRAAERRSLHGGIGVGQGQKGVIVSDDGGELSPDSAYTEDAAANALKMSFGTGSYARKILEGMGWKEGEALGNTAKGLVEPVKAIGNIGNAGLGWPQGRRKQT